MRKSKPNNIVIVDDDTELAGELETILLQAGYKVKIYNSPQFINCFITTQPDALLVDLWFEGVADGLNEIKAIRAQVPLINIPVILMSSDPQVADYADAVSATTYLAKPLDPEQLLTTLEGVLTR